MALTAAEQYAIELINRARLDPAAEAARYDLGLNAGLTSGTITGAPVQVLAPNTELELAAFNHSTWMLANNTFNHTGVDGSSPGDRIVDAGYDLTGSWTWRENLAWAGTTGDVDLESAIDGHHEGLYRSSGHRVNTFAADIREIGVAQVAGEFTQNGTPFNSSMLTLNFASTGTDVFVTGVVYTDADSNDFYGIGEGTTGLTFAAQGNTAQTADAGGYGLAVVRGDAVAVTVSDGATVLATLQIDTNDGNAKLDVVTDADGDLNLALSRSATLQTGIADASLLGIGDLDLTGSADDNTLIGNGGDNVLQGEGGDDMLSGGAGADRLFGGLGDDTLNGGSGRETVWDDLDTVGDTHTAHADVLNGGAGDDTLRGLSGDDRLDGGLGDDLLLGGSGRDTFIFSSGMDEVADFADNVDTIMLNGAALGDADMTVEDVLALGEVVDGDAVFDFGGGHVLTIADEMDISSLGNDLMIF